MSTFYAAYEAFFGLTIEHCSAKFKFTDELRHVLRTCVHLHTVNIVLCINANISKRKKNLFELQNRHVWEPIMRTLISSPRELGGVNIGLWIVDAYDTHAQVLDDGRTRALRALNYSLLGEVMGRHPGVQKLRMQFYEDKASIEEARKAMEEELSSEYMSKIHFTFATKEDFLTTRF